VSETTKAQAVEAVEKAKFGYFSKLERKIADAAYDAGYRQALEDAAKLVDEYLNATGRGLRPERIRALGERGL
jgi:hypothetical protein